MITLAQQTTVETGENGVQPVDAIPSVAEDLRQTGQETAAGAGKLKQLTCLQDSKYDGTDWRVAAGDDIQGRALDNGRIEVTIEGGNVARSGKREDFIVVQVDLVRENVYLLELQAYDSETGEQSAFPLRGSLYTHAENGVTPVGKTNQADPRR